MADATPDPGRIDGKVALALVAMALSVFVIANDFSALSVALVAFGGASEHAAVVDRLIDTAIGGAIALVAFAVWPTWEGPRARDRLATLLDMARAYVGGVLEALADPARYDAAAGGRRGAPRTAMTP